MSKSIAIPDEVVISKIYLIRRQKVMLDKDLAELYDVTTGNLNKAVKRNLFRFPDDFMFQLTEKEFKNLIFQNGTSSLPARQGWDKKTSICFYRTRRCHAVQCVK